MLFSERSKETGDGDVKVAQSHLDLRLWSVVVFLSLLLVLTTVLGLSVILAEVRQGRAQKTEGEDRVRLEEEVFVFGPEGGGIRVKEQLMVGLQFELSLRFRPGNGSGILAAVHGWKDYLVYMLYTTIYYLV